MSLLFPDQYRIGLGASYAVLAKVRGRKVMHWQMQSWSNAESTIPWQRSLSVVSAWLAQAKPGARAIVTLSADLAPMQLLPWREDVTNNEQQSLFANARFRSIYGEAVDNWKLITQPTGYDQPWLASAMDDQLLSALSDQLKGVSVVSAVPLSISLFNTYRTKLPTAASWLLVPELDSLTALYLSGGSWQLLQTIPVSSLRHEAISDILQRETLLAGLKQMPAQIYTASTLAGLNDVINLDAGWEPDQAILPGAALHLLGGAE